MYYKLIPFVLSIPLISLNFASNLVSNTPVTPKVDIVAWQDLVPENDHVLKRIIQEESGGNPEAINPKDTDGRPKYSILQMGWYEFYTWAAMAGIKVEKAEEFIPENLKCSLEFNQDICDPVKQLLIWDWLTDNKPEYLRKWGTFVRMFP